MNIALVAPEFPPEVGGMQVYAVRLALALTHAGHRVTVFTKPGHKPDGYPELQIIDGLQLRRRYDLPLFQRHQFDVWHVLNAGYAWLASYRLPVFVSVYGNDFLYPWVLSENLDLRRRFHLPFGSRFDLALGRYLTARALRRGFDRVRHIFACSRYSEVEFLQRYPQCRGRTSVSYVGVNVPDQLPERSTRVPNAPYELITVCRLADARKNVDIVLRALALLKNCFDFRYTVVGDGELRPALESLARELGLTNRVRFTGRVSDEALPRLLSASDLFVLTSGSSSTSFEGFGIVYLEANAHGLPVLAARCAGAVDAVEEGKSGWFVDRITPEVVAGALAAFFRGEVCFAPDDCRQFARRFSWHRLADHVSGWYTRAASRFEASLAERFYSAKE